MNTLDFEAQKAASLAHQLIKAGRLINQQGLAIAREAFGLTELKQSHLDLFPYIDIDGSSVSEIAKRKGVSKQAISKLVQEMVAMELLHLKTAPEDKRCKQVFINTSGPRALQKGFTALTTLDQQLIKQLGTDDYHSTLEKITALIDSLHTDTPF